MITYTTGRNLAGTLTGDTNVANLAIMDTLINEHIREVITMKPWSYREKTKTISTNTANVHYLPADCGRPISFTVTIGSTKYSPRIVKTREDWDRLTQSTNSTSNTPEAVFVFGKTFSFYPAPASATADAITVPYVREQKDLSVADYTTGTISAITTATTTVTGSGTSWTSQMAGRYIRITETNTANTGDGYWYEIASVESTTSLTLVAPYNGSTITAGSAAYTIGQTSIIPEDHQITPIYRAVEIYFSTIKPELQRAAYYKGLFTEGMKRMQVECGSKTT